ncbi:restriction endonuclease subunit S [Phascolarctobacterium faecium]|uniref:restriction endonuclease subunit S n=1 Tax=Phascolarctobacterium faecium TaxID=33025 RepID=UPI003AEF98DB
MNTKRAPKVRFKGFTDAWEQRKFESIATRASSISADPTLPQVEYEDIISGIGLLNKDVKLKESSKQGIVFNQGDVLYGKLRPYLHNWLLPTFSGLAVGDFWVLQPKDADSSFLFRLIQGQQFDDVANQSTGTKMPRADWNLVSKTLFFIPTSIDEQALIGRYFRSIDNLIALHQRKLDKMKELKKAFLNLIFSQKLRFRGFTESWEPRKLKDITYPAGEKNRENLPLDSYSITNEHGFIPQDERFENGGTMREADKKMYYIVSPHSFAYNPARINIGSIGYQNTDKNVIVSSLYEVFKTSDDVDDRLLWHWFKSSYFQKLIEQFQEGGVRLYFYYDKLCMGTLSLPSFEEQHKIGKYLDTYDNLITLRQEKINQLTKLKTTFLKNILS